MSKDSAPSRILAVAVENPVAQWLAVGSVAEAHMAQRLVVAQRKLGPNAREAPGDPQLNVAAHMPVAADEQDAAAAGGAVEGFALNYSVQ